jgi:Tfp pilus assembly protein PilF
MSLRSIYLTVCSAALFLSVVGRAQQPSTNAPSPATSAQADPAYSLIEKALQLLDAHDIDGAAKKLDAAIKLNSRSTVAHVLRASIYASKELWPQAEEEYTAAEQTAPSDARIKFFLAEVKFSEKQYDAARARYVALESDADKGDFAAYEVFLCDLLGGHEAVAAKELDAFNQIGSKPSYYFSNAAWGLFHKNIKEAKGWLDSAASMYPVQENADYAQTLRNLGYLPLPIPKK